LAVVIFDQNITSFAAHSGPSVIWRDPHPWKRFGPWTPYWPRSLGIIV
jgi:hypothetical protein